MRWTGVRMRVLAAMRAGLLKVAAERGLRRTITFHNRTVEARYFSETLNQTAERLHLQAPVEYPAEVWAQWLSGEHPLDFREEVIGRFRLDEKPTDWAIRCCPSARSSLTIWISRTQSRSLSSAGAAWRISFKLSDGPWG